jgi:hypothetical protein
MVDSDYIYLDSAKFREQQQRFRVPVRGLAKRILSCIIVYPLYLYRCEFGVSLAFKYRLRIYFCQQVIVHSNYF